jgi:hypothetical protein
MTAAPEKGTTGHLSMTAWPELEVKETPFGMTGKPEIGVQVCVYNTVKNVIDFLAPSRGMSLTKLSLSRNT